MKKKTSSQPPLAKEGRGGIFFKGQRVTVLGAGRSGQAAARLLAHLGARVILSDNHPLSLRPRLPPSVEVEIGPHSERLLNAPLIIRSPGIPDHLPLLQQARKKRIPIWSEVELASRLIRPRQLVAITGTNGKTTTTTLVGKIFRAHHHATWVAGNIGTPLSGIVSKIHRRASVVLEVSSYQLENIERFHPTLSAILNITPDHLEHHGSMQAYAAAKARVFENQTKKDVCVLNADDPWCLRLAKRCRCRVLFFSRRRALKEGVFYEKGVVQVRIGRIDARFPLEWKLPGLHNVENALAAIALGVAAGIPLSTIRGVIKAFRGVEHRLEFVRNFKGVRYMNDSKATNVDSTRVALESFDEPLILIMGGRGKGTPYTGLGALTKQHVRHLLVIGEEASRIKKDLGTIVACESVGALPKAVLRAARLARHGDVVLLSPACASFDQYRNYEERGRHFKHLVKRLP